MYKYYEQLLQKRGLTNYRVSKDTGIAQSVLSSWKTGVSTPKTDKMKILADYFGVPVSYFDTGEFNVHKSDSGKIYYFDDKTAELAQKLRDDPEMNMFLSSTMKLDPEQFAAMNSMLRQLLRKDGKLDDD